MTTIPLRYLAEINPQTLEFEAVTADTPVMFLPLETVWADGRANQGRTVPKSAVTSGYTRFRSRDVVCPKVTPTFQAGRSMIAQALGAGTTELHILRPRQDVDPRWVCYAVRSKHFLDEGVTAFQGVAGLQRVPPEYVASFRVADVSLDEQRRIADFLDDRIAHIDQIITARQRQLSLTQQALGYSFLSELAAHGLSAPESIERGWARGSLPNRWRNTTLGRVLRQLTNGYVGPTRDILVEDGVRYVQSTHIKDGQIDFSRRPFFVSEKWHKARPRIHLRHGDVLIVQTGDIGQTAMVPESFGSASCHALLIARVRHDLITPRYLTLFLQSHYGRSAMLARATGALHPHLEAGVKTVPIALPDLRTQAEVVNEVEQRQLELRDSMGVLGRSTRLLAEYKQSLITAAVSGELDVSTASGEIPG